MPGSLISCARTESGSSIADNVINPSSHGPPALHISIQIQYKEKHANKHVCLPVVWMRTKPNNILSCKLGVDFFLDAVFHEDACRHQYVDYCCSLLGLFFFVQAFCIFDQIVIKCRINILWHTCRCPRNNEFVFRCIEPSFRTIIQSWKLIHQIR